MDSRGSGFAGAAAMPAVALDMDEMKNSKQAMQSDIDNLKAMFKKLQAA